MDEERIGIELIVSVVAWFLVVLAAFFFVGAVVGIIAILVGTCLFGLWFVRLIGESDEASAGEGRPATMLSYDECAERCRERRFLSAHRG